MKLPGMKKAKAPGASEEEKALAAAQNRELARKNDEIVQRQKRILNSQRGGRASLLSGSERGVRAGEVRATRGSGGSVTGGSTSTGSGRGGGLSLLSGSARAARGGGGGGGFSGGGTSFVP